MKIMNLTTHGEGGFDMYRVPCILTAPNGDILVYYEARQKDANRRTLLMQRSTDGGDTFGVPETLTADDGAHMLHNPFLLRDGERIFYFHDEDYRHLYVQVSDDCGRSFGPSEDLTDTVLGWRNEGWDVRQFAVSCGHGLRMRSGRLVVPVWMSCSETAHAPAVFASLYSDDGGKTWNRSNLVKSNDFVENPTEAAAAELPDGTVLVTLRHGSQKTRRRAFVMGSGAVWGEAYLDDRLPDPICAGCVQTLSDGDILFSNCAYGDAPCLEARRTGSSMSWSMDARQNLRIRRSTDGGKTWSGGQKITQEGGYSDLAESPDGKYIYCFFENGWIGGNCIFNAHLAFVRIPAEEI